LAGEFKKKKKVNMDIERWVRNRDCSLLLSFISVDKRQCGENEAGDVMDIEFEKIVRELKLCIVCLILGRKGNRWENR